MFTLAVLFYGDPITNTDGILPWKPIPKWNVASVMSFMVVSLTFTGIFQCFFFFVDCQQQSFFYLSCFFPINWMKVKHSRMIQIFFVELASLFLVIRALEKLGMLSNRLLSYSFNSEGSDRS